jgi:outer membrane immunogenic protein
MKKFLLSTIGLVALGMSAPASAADMPVSSPPPAPLPVVYNWSGFYIGANGGWGQSRNCLDFNSAAVGAAIGDGCRDRSGGLVGGQLGYRWQTNQFVFGLEGQGDWADFSHTRVSVIDPFFSTRGKTDAIGLFTGQVGWAWGASLLYLKGGAAVTNNQFDILRTFDGLDLAGTSATRWGSAVGVGWEYGFASNWSVGVEYDHLFMDNSNNSFSAVNPIFTTAVNRIRQDVDMVTLRFNYRFGGYGGYGGYTGSY